MYGLPRWANLSLRTKLTLLIEGSMLVLGVGTGWLASVRLEASIDEELRMRGFAAVADLAARSVGPLLAGDLAALRRLVTNVARQDHVEYVAVLGPDGRVVMHSDLSQLGAKLAGTVGTLAVASHDAGLLPLTSRSPGASGYDLYSPIQVVGERLGSVVLGYSRAPAQAALARMRRDLASVWLFAAVFSGCLAFLVSSYISRPIRRIASAMRQAPDDEVGLVGFPHGKDELGNLVASYNEMARDLATHRQHLSELVEARTAALREANTRLEREVAERARMEGELLTSRQELRDLASDLRSVREQERADVAREIHDELGQALTVLKMDVHWVGQRICGAGDAVTSRLAGMSNSIDATVQAVRRLSSRLRPQLLDDLGLSAAIEWQAREFQQHSGVTCEVASDPEDIVLDEASSTALFRICQETLTNVARHASASRVDIALTKGRRSVELAIADNGHGLDAAEPKDPRARGLLGIRERVRALGGVVAITSRPGQGTTVTVSLPC